MLACGTYEYPLTDKMLADYRQVKNTERRVAQQAAAQQAAAGQALTKRKQQTSCAGKASCSSCP